MTGDDRPADHPADRPGPPGQARPTGTDHPRPTESDRPRPTDPSRLVTLAEAATITGTSAEAIRSRIRRRTLRAQRGNHGQWMVHRDELETGRPAATGTDHPAGHPVIPGRRPVTGLPTDRPTEEATELRDRLEALTAELAAERLDRAAERLELAETHGRELGEARERAGRAEAQGEAARAAQATAEAAAARAEARADTLADELRELRRPWLERLARAIRGQG